jgi:Zn-dependent peptidase ImmA (M78 family)/transcriptional regulator with XRE-family HTH domain
LNSLAYARESRNLRLDEVAAELRTKPSQLVKFEAGASVPSTKQWAKLSAIYGASIYRLASPLRPNLEPLAVDLRKEHLAAPTISPRGTRAFFESKLKAETVAGLAVALDWSPKVALPYVKHFNHLHSVEGEVRNALFQGNMSVHASEPERALHSLRYRIENAGLFTFVGDVPPEDYRGFFTHLHTKLSLIFINRKTFSPKARIFTLLHELGHFLLREDGISDPFVLNNDLERACNKFASNLMLADNELDDLVSDRAFGADVSNNIKAMSALTLLSEGAMAYRLLKSKHISAQQYSIWKSQVNLTDHYGAEDPHPDEDDADDEVLGDRKGQYALNVIMDSGYLAVELVEAAHLQGLIDDVDVARILNARGATRQKTFRIASNRVQGF